MKALFKEFISTFHTSRIPHPSKREFTLLSLPSEVKKVTVLIGMRRSGKTWSFFQIIQDLLAKGIDISQILYINFEDDRLLEVETKNLNDIVEAYFELYPDYSYKENIYFFFDEIQEVKGWEKFIRRLLDQEKIHIFISGSSCKMLSKEIASSLRGRTLVYEVFPFSFREYLHKLNSEIPSVLGTKQRTMMVSFLNSFLRLGGFPEVIGASSEVHRAVLQGYAESVMYRDIVDRYAISNIQVLKQLLFHCVRNSSRVFSINKMYLSLKSAGYHISKDSLYDYITYFEDAYCIFSIEKYDLSQRKSTTGMKKIYVVDQGLITAFSMASQFDVAAQLETAVFSYLRRQSHELFYYKTADSKEIDFLMLFPDSSLKLFQVCVSLTNEGTKQREVIALQRAMEELKLKSGYIITLEQEDSLTVPQGTIYVIPAWKLFLYGDFSQKSLRLNQQGA